MARNSTSTSAITIDPMTDEDAARLQEVLKESTALRKKMLARRKGKPVPSSWKLIRRTREER